MVNLYLGNYNGFLSLHPMCVQHWSMLWDRRNQPTKTGTLTVLSGIYQHWTADYHSLVNSSSPTTMEW